MEHDEVYHAENLVDATAHALTDITFAVLGMRPMDKVVITWLPKGIQVEHQAYLFSGGFPTLQELLTDRLGNDAGLRKWLDEAIAHAEEEE